MGKKKKLVAHEIPYWAAYAQNQGSSWVQDLSVYGFYRVVFCKLEHIIDDKERKWWKIYSVKDYKIYEEAIIDDMKHKWWKISYFKDYKTYEEAMEVSELYKKSYGVVWC
jgi:hypothetical protein